MFGACSAAQYVHTTTPSVYCHHLAYVCNPIVLSFINHVSIFMVDAQGCLLQSKPSKVYNLVMVFAFVCFVCVFVVCMSMLPENANTLAVYIWNTCPESWYNFILER